MGGRIPTTDVRPDRLEQTRKFALALADRLFGKGWATLGEETVGRDERRTAFALNRHREDCVRESDFTWIACNGCANAGCRQFCGP